MNRFKTSRPFIITLSLSLLFIALTVFLMPRSTVQALDNVSIYYVAPSCAGVPAPCFTSIQTAVDAVDEPTDVIKVAAGIYTDVHVRPRNDISTTGVVTQVVYVIKTATIQGGYTTANWNTPNPDTNLTTLDAQGQGRVLYIAGDISLTIEGLHLTGGNSAGLGGRPGGYDGGGGVYAISATVSLNRNGIYGNTAFSGGGIWLYQSHGALSNNTIQSNNASYCGGVRLQNSPLLVSANTILSNTAITGGGLCVAYSDQMTVISNTISNNTASQDGGGILASSSAGTLISNTISNNVANRDGGGLLGYSYKLTTFQGNIVSNNHAGQNGGGLSLEPLWGPATFQANIVANNQAGQAGGGLFLSFSDEATFLNTIIADNTAMNGGGVYLLGPTSEFLYTTLANNHPDGLYGTGAYDCDGACSVWPSIITMTNTIVSGQAVGVYADFSNQPGVGALAKINLENTLWYNNTQDWSGGGTIITGIHNYRGNPAFINAPAGNYHIGATSAAIDRGVDVGVYTDLDGDLRPEGYSYDLGADEYRAATLVARNLAWQPFLNPGQVTTYTLVVSNAGVGATTQVVLTDTLPAEQKPLAIAATQGTCLLGSQWGANVTCSLGNLAPNAIVQLTLTVQTTDMLPPVLPWTIRNKVQAAAVEANSNVAVSDSTLIDCRARLNDQPKEYAGIQAAVDAAQVNDVIKVSGTSCSDLHAFGGLRQVVYLSKTLTLRGGYTSDFMEPPDPVAHPTTLDALGQGRVIYLAQGTQPTLEGLRLTSGNSYYGGGDDYGGGLYAFDSAPTIRNCQIDGNIGGGMFFRDGTPLLIGNSILSNTNAYGTGDGAGLWIQNSTARLFENKITTNVAMNSGGGIYAQASTLTLFANQIVANTAAEGGGIASLNTTISLTANSILSNTAGRGGGIYIDTANPVFLNENIIAGNVASTMNIPPAAIGGGLYIMANAVTLRNNAIANNRANIGGGMFLWGDMTLVNTMIVDNQADTTASGIFMEGGSLQAIHTTLAHNTGGDGSGLYLALDPELVSANLTNTIVANHTVGITGPLSMTAKLNATLWSGNGIDGALPTNSVNNYYGDPVFVNPAAENYHIGSTSAAIDRGVSAGVATDIDGQARPNGVALDLGMDEYYFEPLTAVIISGPTQGAVGFAYTFSANPHPLTATIPITYTWEPAPMSGQGTPRVTYTWGVTGAQAITVTAENVGSTVISSHVMTVEPRRDLYLPLVLRQR